MCAACRRRSVAPSRCSPSCSRSPATRTCCATSSPAAQAKRSRLLLDAYGAEDGWCSSASASDGAVVNFGGLYGAAAAAAAQDDAGSSSPTTCSHRRTSSPSTADTELSGGREADM
ncbi:hypothetical protein U9M48_032910 [Paspalum notatum var. saurae]|uniref:Uncharacterized protein n=1 Tax=Paspalum notatum var. saurae TaxID=547442 RepID=A0AAQ3U5P5_PASNO